jgi:DNA polymerase-3 subunit beta
MKLKCARKSLQEAILSASRIIGRATTKPVLQQVKMEATADKLTLLATDGEIGLRLEVTDVDIAEPGMVLVPGARLAGLVQEVPDESLNLETKAEDGGPTCHIWGERSDFRLLGDDPKLFPDIIPEFLEAPGLELAAGDFAEMVGKTIFAVASVSTRYSFDGVYFVVEDGRVEMVATDGHRLARIRKKTKPAAELGEGVIIATKAMSEAARLIASEDERVQISVGAGGAEARGEQVPREVCMQVGRRLLWSRLIEGRFPPYKDVIPKDLDKKVVLPREEFLSAIRQAALLTTEESGGVKLSFKGGKLVASSRSAEAGDATIELPVDYSGAELDMSFNPQFLTEVLRVVEDETIEFSFKESATPALVKAGADYQYLVMPLAV